MRNIIDILKQINEDPSKIENWKTYQPFKMFIEYAFLPEKKFELPEGIPPFKPDDAPLGLSPSNLLNEVRRFYIFTKERPLPNIKKEMIFTQMLESVHPQEAEILLMVKDQSLTTSYPNLQACLLKDHGILSESYHCGIVEQSQASSETQGTVTPIEQTPKKRGRPKKTN